MNTNITFKFDNPLRHSERSSLIAIALKSIVVRFVQSLNETSWIKNSSLDDKSSFLLIFKII